MKQENESVCGNSCPSVNSQDKEAQSKKVYVKPVFQKHETLRVAANATKSNKGVQENYSDLFK